MPSGDTSATANALNAGNHYCSIVDANSCPVFTEMFVITEPPALLIDAISSTPVLCNSGNDGTATVTVSGGTGNYSYQWSSGGTAAVENNLAAGTYICTVTDANNCSTSASVVVTEPTTINIQIAQVNITCNGLSNGTATALATGGTGGYSYLWSDNSTLAVANSLSATSYTVVVTDSNGCSKSAAVTISQPDSLSAMVTQTSALCYGTANATASVAVSGGTPGYLYNWSNGDLTDSVTGLAAGTYTVVITDANNCVTNVNVAISEPDSIILNVTTTEPTCHGGSDGSAFVNVTGGTGPYAYIWGGNQPSLPSLSGLSATSFSVAIQDANGCFNAISVTISEPGAITGSTSSTDANCGQSNGSVHITASGGTGNLNYSWTSGGTTDTDVNLPAGNYTVTVTDANGCMISAIASVSNVSAPSVTFTQTDVQCFGGSDGAVNLMISGGIPGYIVAWNNVSGLPNINNLTAGTYTYTVTDSGNCVSAGSVTIVEPTAMALSATSVNETLGNDGSIDLVVSGGTPNYSYLWSNGSMIEDPSGLAAGVYTVTVTDDHGCTMQLSVTVSSSVGISEHSISNDQFEVYPNPSNGNFTLKSVRSLVVEIYSGTGQLIRVVNLSTENNFTVQMDHFSNGLYFIRSNNASTVWMKKLVVIR
jgi:hypothetical protein